MGGKGLGVGGWEGRILYEDDQIKTFLAMKVTTRVL